MGHHLLEQEIQWSSPAWGNYFRFLLDHPELRQYTPWSDKALAEDVDQWLGAAGLWQTARILDIGSGFGLYAIEFAKRGHSVVAVECVESFVRTSRELARDADVEVEWMRAKFPCPIQGTFDLACVTRCFSLWDHGYREVLRSIRSLLKPGGVLITDGHSPARPFSESREGDWHLREDGSIVNWRQGTGHNLLSGTLPDYFDKHQILEQAVPRAGFEVQTNHPWLIGTVA